ncbi:hypothetical protein ACHAQJ_008543 [Trichoderma viride]
MTFPSLTGAGIGIDVIFTTLINGVARNPTLRGQLFSYAILGFAFVEAIALFDLMIALMAKFVSVSETSPATELATELNQSGQPLRRPKLPLERLEKLRPVDGAINIRGRRRWTVEGPGAVAFAQQQKECYSHDFLYNEIF